MKFNGFIGPTSSLKSLNVDAQRCINWIPEIVESGTGKEAAQFYYKPTDGLLNFLEIGTGPIRCIHVDSFGTTFVVSGGEVYKIVESFAGVYTRTAQKLGDLLTSTGPVIAASLDPGTDQVTVFCDGSIQNYLYLNPLIGGETFGTYASYGYPPVNGATHVQFIDGYLVFSIPDFNQFYVSDPNDPFVDPLSFASAEASPDKIKAILAFNRELWIFNEQSTEVWANVGNADFPFERISGGFIEIGCIAGYSPAKTKGIAFWLSQNGSVYMAQGLSPKRISTHSVEQSIQTALDIKEARAFAYEKDGHTYYQINFADLLSWTYDVSTGQWHERAYFIEGEFQRHRADTYAYYDKFENLSIVGAGGTLPEVFGNAYSRHYVGDYASNKVYVLDGDTNTDDGQMIKRLRRAPHVSAGLKRVKHKSFQVDMETGVGLDGNQDPQGANPVMMMRFSDDGGHTWSNEKTCEIGKIGERKRRVKWNRLGISRDRVYEVSITDPVPVTLIGAELDLEVGYS